MVILELIHALKPNFVEGLCLLDTELTQAPPGLLVIHNNRTDRMAPAGDESFYFLTYHSILWRVTENQDSIPEREPEKRLPHLRKAAGAQITQSRLGEVVTRNNNSRLIVIG